tara:strand:+ start:14370 stop:15263 length:894 start_codon:yes stop_codon:yes gene_type:complete
MKYFSFEQIKYWYRKYIPKKIRTSLRKIIPFWVELRFFSYKTKNFDLDNQGHGEAKKLIYLCNELNIYDGYYVDIGASDGWSSSCTYPFAKNDNFKGLSIELDKKAYKKMEFIYKNFKNVQLSNSKITPKNVVKLLEEYSVPKNFDVLNIDIDSYDLFVIKTLLNSYKPKIISMEINEKIPPPIYFTVNYDEEHFWKGDDFFGCSIQAAYEEVIKYEYRLVELVYNNAIFILEDLDISIPDLSTSDAYKVGYINKPDRKERFHYNNKHEILFEMNYEDSVNYINELFSDYSGKYLIK